MLYKKGLVEVFLNPKIITDFKLVDFREKISSTSAFYIQSISHLHRKSKLEC